MNRNLFTVLIALLSFAACQPAASPPKLTTIDLNADFPEKTLTVQDFMDVEYVPLETAAEVVLYGSIRAVGQRYAVITNYNDNGTVYLFDLHSGRAVGNFNHQGQGGVEYNYIDHLALDEENGEVFILDQNARKIQVYDLQGHFRRSLRMPEGTFWSCLYSFDRQHLIAYDKSIYMHDGEERGKPFYHALISKQDGSIAQPIAVPFERICSPQMSNPDKTAFATIHIPPVVPAGDQWVIVETSSDTLYTYPSHGKGLEPLLTILRSQEPERLLRMEWLTPRYCFLSVADKAYDFQKGGGFGQQRPIVYDKQEQTTYRYKLLNGDMQADAHAYLGAFPATGSPVAAACLLNADLLVNLCQNGKLKEGPLKDLALRLHEEDNPVLMLMRHKDEK